MKLSRMISSFRHNIDDANGTRFDKEEVRDLFNQSLDDIYNRLLALGIYPLRKSVDVTIVASTQEIALPSDFDQAITVKHTSYGYIDIVEEEKCVEAVGSCVYITSRVDSVGTAVEQLIGWHIKASGALDLTITYAPQMEAFKFNEDSFNEDDELIILPKKFHNVIVSGATVIALGADEQNIGTWSSLFEQQFQQMLSGLERRNPRDSGVVDVGY